MDLRSSRFRSESNTPLTSGYRVVASNRPRCSVGPFGDGSTIPATPTVPSQPYRNSHGLLGFRTTCLRRVYRLKFQRLRGAYVDGPSALWPMAFRPFLCSVR